MAKTKAATKGGSKRDKPPALDQYKKPLIGVALALLAYQLFKGMMAKEILRVDMTATANELEIREVFFGEDKATGNTNYAVLCYPENALYPISSVFQDAANDGSAPAEFRVMDCDVPMPGSEEGKTVIGRFKLSKKTRPVVFVSGAIGSPKQVPAKYLKTGAMLTKALKNLLEPKAEKIETTQDLRNKCLDKDTCALLLKGGKVSPKYVKEAVQKLVVEYPKVTFAAVDTSVLYVHGVEAEFLSELVPGMPRFIVFKKTSGSTTQKDAGRLKTTAVALDVDVAYGPMSNLVASVVSGTASMTKISSTPTIKTRTKKLEKSENEKRQRRKNRESGGSSSGSSSSSSDGGAFHSGENDGSAAGRRAERERRRAEHRKNNPNYREKTPEEIKEMERQRRIRMEEEAKKWNMAPEDADPDGGDGADPETFMEDWDEDEEQDLDEEEEEDEDIMDLD